jgi:hypothetical protein
MAEAPNQSKQRKVRGPVPPGADVERFRRTGETVFVSTPVSGPTNIPGSRGGGRGKRTPTEEDVNANRQAELSRIANQKAQEEANKREAQREAQARQKMQQLVAQKKASNKQKQSSVARNVATGLRSPPKVFKATVKAGADRTAKELNKPFSIPLTFGITGTRIEARSDVAKANLQRGALTDVVGGGQTMREFEQAIGLLYPETKGKVVVATATGAGITRLPAVGQSLTGFGVAGSSARQLDKGATGAERKALLIQGIGGALGGTLPILPFVKGKVATVTGGRTPTAQVTPKETSTAQPIGPKLFGPTREAVTDVKTTTGTIDIGLVPEGKGFGFTISEQKQLVGTKGVITTSARDLAPSGGGIVKVQPGPEGKGLFFSPTPKELGGASRLSRLGLADNPFKIPKADAPLSFKQEKPQIVFQKDATIRNIGYSSSELETTIGPGAQLLVQRRGSAVLQGQKVQIQEIVGVKGTKGSIGKVKGATKLKSGTVTKGVNPTAPLSPKVRIRTGARSRPTVSRGSPKISTPTISVPRTGGGGSVPVPRTRPTSPIIRLARGSSTTSPPVTRFGPSTSRPQLNVRLSGSSSKRNRRGQFGVEVRRFGVFRPIGTTRTLGGALNLGKNVVGGTLSATFRIRGAGGTVRAPSGFRRTKRRGEAPLTFVEKREKRLSRPKEIKQIQASRKKKKR